MSPSGPVTDFEDHHVPVAAVEDMVRLARGLESRTHSGEERCLAGRGRQNRLTLQNVDQFVLFAVRVHQRRLSARGNPGQIHAEVPQAEEVAECPASPLRAIRPAKGSG